MLFFKSLLLIYVVQAAYDSPVCVRSAPECCVLSNGFIWNNKSLVFHALRYLGGFLLRRRPLQLPLSSLVAVLRLPFFQNCDGGGRYRFGSLNVIFRHFVDIK